MSFQAMMHLPASLLTWITFGVFAVLSILRQLYQSRNFFAKQSVWSYCLPGARAGWKSFTVDFVTNAIPRAMHGLTGGVYIFFTAVVSVAITNMLAFVLPAYQLQPVGYFGLMSCSIACFVVADFSYFMTHLAQHRFPVLWELHKVHHSATFLTPLTTKRKHPFSEVLDQISASALIGIPIGIFSFLYGLSGTEILSVVGSVTIIGEIVVLDALKHSSFKVSFGHLDHIFISPHMHQLHHSEAERHWNRNFGNKLSIWDKMFGTKMLPVAHEDFVFGLGEVENKVFESVVAVYVHPLKVIAGIARRRMSVLPLSDALPTATGSKSVIFTDGA